MPTLCKQLVSALLFCFLTLVISGGMLRAADEPPVAASTTPKVATPKSTLQEFLELAQVSNFTQAGTYLDYRLPRRQAAALAEKLYILIDQQGWLTLSKVSDAPEGNIADSSEHDLELVGTIRINGAIEPIVLRRIIANDESTSWKFDRAFLEKIPALYETIEEHSLARYFPEWTHSVEFLGIRIWQWFTLLLALACAVILALLLAKIYRHTIVRLNSRFSFKLDKTFIDESYRPIKYLALVGVFHLITLFLAIPFAARNTIYSIETFAVMVLLASVGLKATNFFIRHLQRVLERSQRTNALAMLSPTRKLIKLLIITIAGVYFLTYIGINVTAIVAGLGIGGIAVALAGQKTLENLIGGISLIIDQPVRVGDFCRFGDNKVGTVEDIGLRSTRIRTLDRTVVSVPNAEFSQIQLENFGKRDLIRYHQMIGLRYETTPDQMRYLLIKLKELLVAHPMVDLVPARVRFLNFAASALELEILAYVKTSDFNVFLAVREDLNLRIMEIVDACGTGFAFPSTTVYFERSAGVNKDKSNEIHEKVSAMRDAQEMHLPFYPEDKIAKIQDSIPFPLNFPQT